MDFEEFKKKFQIKDVLVLPNQVSQSPLVSISVLTYQHLNFIRECLDNILAQEISFPYEILLGDDDSTDGTREICIEYAEKYPDKIRLFLHHRENNIEINNSPTGRFNVIYNFYSARGEYIALCEGDDYWTDPLKLQKQVDFLEKNKDYIAHTHNSYFSNESESNNKMVLFSDLKSGRIELKDICPTRSFHTASILFRKTALNNLDFKFFSERVKSGDKFLFMHLWLNGYIYYDDTPISVYRRNAGGMSKSHNLNRFMDADIKMYEYFKNKVPEEFKNELEEAKNYFKLNRFNFLMEKSRSARLVYYYLSLIPIAGKSKHLSYFQFKKLSRSFFKKMIN